MDLSFVYIFLVAAYLSLCHACIPVPAYSAFCAEYPGDHVLRMIRLKEMHFPPNRFRHKLMDFQWCLATLPLFASLAWPAARARPSCVSRAVV